MKKAKENREGATRKSFCTKRKNSKAVEKEEADTNEVLEKLDELIREVRELRVEIKEVKNELKEISQKMKEKTKNGKKNKTQC